MTAKNKGHCVQDVKQDEYCKKSLVNCTEKEMCKMCESLSAGSG